MKNKYTIINDALNDYALKYSKTFFYHNYQPLQELSEMTIAAIDEVKKNILIKYDMYLDLYTSINIARNFLQTLDKKYVEQFDKYINSGVFNFVDQYDDNIYEDNKNKYSYAGKINDNKSIHYTININVQHTYNDPATIIHEFFHIINGKQNSDTRSTLTEMISIYFEDKCLDYMLMIGYDEKEIAKAHIIRNIDTYHCAKDLKELLPIINAYEIFGNIDENTYHLKEKFPQYSKIFPLEKQEWEKSLNKLSDKIIKKQKVINPAVVSKYVFCDNIVNYLCIQANSDIKEKMIMLNELVHKMSVLEALEYIRIPLESEDFNKKLVEATKIKLQNNISILEKEKKNNK